jgi:hypothetical protein
MEAQVLTALNVAEAVRTKLLAIAGLKERIDKRDLELAVRNYIAVNPWMISPQWETFRIEKRVTKLVSDLATETHLNDEQYRGRVDLVLSSGSHLLVLEFIRPGLRMDWDHLSRFMLYIQSIRSAIEANTGGPFTRVSGYAVADRLDAHAPIVRQIESMRRDDMYAMDWQTLLNEAIAAWEEYLVTLAGRAPTDSRLQALLEAK